VLSGTGGGGDPGPTPPIASFTASPTSGTAPLQVSFSDTSSGSPSSWAWDFDNDGTVDATVQHPSYTYAEPGSYTVSLTVANADGSDVETKAGYISVAGAGGGGQALTVIATDDAYVDSASPTSNFGNANNLRVRLSGSKVLHTYLKFSVTGAGSPSSAVVRLHVTDASNHGGDLYLVPNSTWSEASLTWSNRPAAAGSLLHTVGSAAVGTWVEWDVSDVVTADGTYSFVLVNASDDVVRYASSEGTAATRPQLVLSGTGGGGDPGPTPPIASFTASPTSGTAPLQVSFSDTSSGSSSSWAWDFDNDGTVDATVQHPSYTYAEPGNYTVSLTVANADGSDTETKLGYISVAQPGGGGQALTVIASEDTYVDSSSPSSNYGTATNLRVRLSGTKVLHTYLKFSVTGAGSPSSAVVRLHVIDASNHGGDLYLVPNSTWSEASLTWSNRPAAAGSLLHTVGSAAVGSWVEWDVSDVVTADGTYSFVLVNASDDVVRYASSEGTAATRPQLVLSP
ncbi:MAG TPA: DNRLRE domain-containing protein, partial [Pseudonocardiaceae bacterium]|nr:DNRLRE domain-containing protein [Pseudonocardiaceae bacterium]